ncbi:MAG: CBS domain-containing protein [Nanoarchaeota archaeon]|nr:CBS domain-containing protein [Nanoarchaeota archaeon]
MSKPVKTITKDATIRHAIKLMDESNIGVLPVVENDKPIGVITERDIIRRVIAKNLDMDRKTAADVMTKNPVTINHDVSILEATRLMSENNFRRLLVVKDGKLVGIVTAKDVIEVMST